MNKLYEFVDNLSHQAGAHALRAGVDFLYNDDTITYPRSIRGVYAFSSLANFLSGAYNNAGFTQTFGATVVSQTNPNVGIYAQDEWKVSPSSLTLNARAALRPAVPRDDRHRQEQRLAARRVRVVADPVAADAGPRQRRPLLRSRAAARARECAPVGEQHDRPGEPAADQHQPVADAGRRAGISEHPQRRRPVGHAAEPDDDESEHAERVLAAGGVEVERQLGERSTVSVGYQYTRGVNLIISVNQNVPVVRGGRHEQRLSPGRDLRQQQPVLAVRDVDLPRPARVVRAAAGAMGVLPRLLHLVEGDGQRRRVLLQLADRSVRSLEGLGPIRRRPAAPSRAERRRQFVDGARAHDLGASESWLPGERHRCSPTRRCRSTSRPASRRSRAPRAGRS